MTDNVGREKLKAYAERVARLEEEKDAIVSDIAEIKKELKQEGYSTKAFNAALKRHRMTGEERNQADLFDEETALYLDAMDGKDSTE